MADPPVCGDGLIQGEEECDDGNLNPEDECADCVFECGKEGEFKGPAFHCYKFHGGDYNSGFAKQTCAGWRNSTLVTVTSEAELNWLLARPTMQQNTWIGATDVNSSGKFQWLTGEPMSLVDFWAEGYPKDIGQDAHCAAFMSSIMRWQNTPCTDEKHLICEISPPGKPAP